MGRFSDILAKSAEKTDVDLASEISSLVHLTNEEIEQLSPTRADKEKLIHLLEIVNAATDDNKKISLFKENIENLAGVALRLIKVVM